VVPSPLFALQLEPALFDDAESITGKAFVKSSGVARN